MLKHEVISRLESAAVDVAANVVEMFKLAPGTLSEKQKKEMERLIKSGCPEEFHCEAMADFIYEDDDFIVDMVGDMTCGLDNRQVILDELAKDRQFAKAVERIKNR